jgi:hypothetical protein
MNAKSVMRDERTVSVENSSYRLAYLVLSYGLLLCIGYRSFVMKQSSWDLMGLVIVGGGVATMYQGSQGILNSRSARMMVVGGIVAVVVAAVVVFSRR